jgi:hypothetical protein
MNKIPLIDPDKYHILSIKLTRCFLECSDDYRDNPKEVKKTKFGFGSEIGYDFSNKGMRVRLNILIIGTSDDEIELGVKAEYGFEFFLLIDNLDDYIYSKDDSNLELIIDKHFGSTIMGIVYSTTRGILLERLKNTHFEGVILPIIDPTELLDPNKTEAENKSELVSES